MFDKCLVRNYYGSMIHGMRKTSIIRDQVKKKFN